MTSSYYDAIVLGTRLSALCSAALLARRGLRVLLVGQGEPAPRYRVLDHWLPRAPFALHGVHSPIAKRLFSELAMHQRLRQRSELRDPVAQIVLPGHRLDLAQDAASLEREIEREFPEVRRPIEDFHRNLDHLSSSFDRVVARDLVWPPETFLERREFARACANLPFDRDGHGPDLLAELPERHPFHLAVQAPVRFADGIDPDDTSTLRTMRLYSAWRRGALALDEGLHTLRSMLVERLQAASGDTRLEDRVGEILIRRGQVRGVRLAETEEEIGCDFVLAGIPVSDLVRLLPERAPIEALFERVGEPQTRYVQYTLNLVVRQETVPAGLSRHVFSIRHAHSPLVADNALFLEAEPPTAQGLVTLSVQCLLPRRGIEEIDGYLEGMRARVLSAVAEIVPFLEEGLVLVDSPHDGLPPTSPKDPVELSVAERWTRGPRTMGAIYSIPTREGLGVCGLPFRTPLKHLLLCNGQVVPGLGIEGELLTAWSTARIVTRSDRSRAWMRRGLWTKVEI